MSEYERPEGGIDGSGRAENGAAHQSGGERGFSLPQRLTWIGAWLAVLAVAVWLEKLSYPWIGVAALAAGVWSFGRAARRGWWGIGATLALWGAVAVAAGVQFRLGQVARDWPELRVAIENAAAQAIGGALDDLVDRGEDAVEGIAALVAADAGELRRPASFQRLETIRRQTRMSAVAIYQADGTPVAWAGEHRGMIPGRVRRGELEYAFHRGPLFGYLYFAHPLAGGRTALAAVLLDAGIPTSAEAPPFAERFAAQRGVLPRFMAPERAEGEAVWDWATDRPILSVTFGALTQESWHARVAASGRWAVLALWGLSVLLLALSWYRGGSGSPGVPVAVITVALFVLPLGGMLEARGLFSPLNFVLAGPGDVTLGQLLVLLVGVSVWMLTRTPTANHWPGVPLPVRTSLVALAVPLLTEVVRRSASLGLLSGRAAGGVSLVLVATLLLAIAFFLALRRPRPPARRTPAALPAVAGVALSAALAIGVVLLWRPGQPVPVWVLAAWTAPFALLSIALARAPHRLRTVTAWLAAGWLGGSAAAPYLWTAHMEARIDAAEAELAHLGTEPDPYLDYLLRQFAERALFLAAEGETGVNLLYRSWVASGLAREGYEARITQWRGDRPDAELRLSDLELEPAFSDAMVRRAQAAEEPILERYTEHAALHYLLLVPLPDEQVISVATPPRRRLGRATALARFLHPENVVTADEEYEALTLVSVPAEAPEVAEPAVSETEVHWLRTRDGWRSETLVAFPTGAMHAHLLVVTPSLWMLLIRGLLLQALALTGLTLVWSLARTLCGEPLGLPGSWRRWPGTFRGRLTLALFGFFLLPMLVFGAVAYRALSQELVRTAGAVANRSLELAAPALGAQPLPELGQRVRADLLLYRQGGLVGASAPEVLDLGLFQTWLPPSIALAFATAEETQALEQRRLAGNRYTVAYRRVGDDGVLAAPVPLATGEIARRQREFSHAFLLMMLLGAGLSVVLALLVGRALSRPIERLGRATAAVGAGNLRLRLPEDRADEFGGVYRAFNRMVRRLRRARAAEVRTARVLAWGEMARQVAHEIKNPLTPIKLSVQHLRRAYGDARSDFPQVLERNVDAILREIDRLGEIARAFARFGAPGQQAGALEQLDLHRVVAETLVLYRGGAAGISFGAELDPGLPRVLARDGELREVLLNLLENAREAVDGRGEIRISAAPMGGGEWVRLDVSDTGTGIPPEQLPRIFEPQFSTRTSGTGLGLAIVRRLVESWGGQISAASEPGHGTTVHIRLRAADGEPRTPGASERDPE